MFTRRLFVPTVRAGGEKARSKACSFERLPETIWREVNGVQRCVEADPRTFVSACQFPRRIRDADDDRAARGEPLRSVCQLIYRCCTVLEGVVEGDHIPTSLDLSEIGSHHGRVGLRVVGKKRIGPHGVSHSGALEITKEGSVAGTDVKHPNVVVRKQATGTDEGRLQDYRHNVGKSGAAHDPRRNRGLDERPTTHNRRRKAVVAIGIVSVERRQLDETARSTEGAPRIRLGAPDVAVRNRNRRLDTGRTTGAAARNCRGHVTLWFNGSR